MADYEKVLMCQQLLETCTNLFPLCDSNHPVWNAVVRHEKETVDFLKNHLLKHVFGHALATHCSDIWILYAKYDREACYLSDHWREFLNDEQREKFNENGFYPLGFICVYIPSDMKEKKRGWIEYIYSFVRGIGVAEKLILDVGARLDIELLPYDVRPNLRFWYKYYANIYSSKKEFIKDHGKDVVDQIGGIDNIFEERLWKDSDVATSEIVEITPKISLIKDLLNQIKDENGHDVGPCAILCESMCLVDAN